MFYVNKEEERKQSKKAGSRVGDWDGEGSQWFPSFEGGGALAINAPTHSQNFPSSWGTPIVKGFMVERVYRGTQYLV